ncbi:MAG: hypothetical protein ACM3PY_08600 [Omnitrophica WOR_2 bacterium]
MNTFLIVLIILIIMVCLTVIGLQLRATYTRMNRKAAILRSIVAGFALNLALLLIALLKSSLISPSPVLPEEYPILVLQGIFTLIFYGVFEFRNKIRRHLSEFDREYGDEQS